MCRQTKCVVPILTVGLLVLETGCQSGAAGASLLSLFGLSERPVVVALVVEPGVLDPFTPHEKLRKAMSETIKRPVRLDLCLPLQLEPNLTLGFYDFAFITPACYVGMKDRERSKVIAVAVDEAGRASHSAVLVVAANSKIESVEQLRGKTVAFGPRGDARTHHAGLALLREHGLKKTDLSLEVFPLPGALKHFPKMRDIAQSVINGSCDAGFIDEAAFDAFEQTSEVEGEPTRDKLRVLARTVPVPEKLVIRSPKAKAETVSQVADFLLTAGERHPDVLRPLLFSAYQEPSATMLASCQRLIAPREPGRAGATSNDSE
ncbi:MAG: phosphate/phosphite/phosphonate ABC transporter substrate-binding protein [Phycisphaerae bacterium]